MKESYRTIAGILLAGIVLTVLFAVLTRMSFSENLGQHMDIPKEDYAGYADSEQTKEICDREPPVIIRKISKVWRPEEEIRIDHVFEAVDTEGKQLEIEVLDIQDEDGNSRMECYQRADHKTVFSERGMYLLELQAADEQKKSAVRKYMLLVDHRQGGI